MATMTFYPYHFYRGRLWLARISLLVRLAHSKVKQKGGGGGRWARLVISHHRSFCRRPNTHHNRIKTYLVVVQALVGANGAVLEKLLTLGDVSLVKGKKKGTKNASILESDGMYRMRK